MRILVEKNEAKVETKSGVLTLGSLLEILALKTKMSVYKASLIAEMDWPTPFMLRKDKNNALKPFIRLLDVYGYDVLIIKRDNSE